MPTKRTRIARHRVEGVSDTALWVMGDRKLYPEPEYVNRLELRVIPSPDYPTTDYIACKAFWDSRSDMICSRPLQLLKSK
jgi:hypothetical protein